MTKISTTRIALTALLLSSLSCYVVPYTVNGPNPNRRHTNVHDPNFRVGVFSASKNKLDFIGNLKRQLDDAVVESNNAVARGDLMSLENKQKLIMNLASAISAATNVEKILKVNGEIDLFVSREMIASSTNNSILPHASGSQGPNGFRSNASNQTPNEYPLPHMRSQLTEYFAQKGGEDAGYFFLSEKNLSGYEQSSGLGNTDFANTKERITTKNEIDPFLDRNGQNRSTINGERRNDSKWSHDITDEANEDNTKTYFVDNDYQHVSNIHRPRSHYSEARGVEFELDRAKVERKQNKQSVQSTLSDAKTRAKKSAKELKESNKKVLRTAEDVKSRLNEVISSAIILMDICGEQLKNKNKGDFFSLQISRMSTRMSLSSDLERLNDGNEFTSFESWTDPWQRLKNCVQEIQHLAHILRNLKPDDTVSQRSAERVVTLSQQLFMKYNGKEPTVESNVRQVSSRDSGMSMKQNRRNIQKRKSNRKDWAYEEENDGERRMKSNRKDWTYEEENDKERQMKSNRKDWTYEEENDKERRMKYDSRYDNGDLREMFYEEELFHSWLMKNHVSNPQVHSSEELFRWWLANKQHIADPDLFILAKDVFSRPTPVSTHEGYDIASRNSRRKSTSNRSYRPRNGYTSNSGNTRESFSTSGNNRSYHSSSQESAFRDRRHSSGSSKKRPQNFYETQDFDEFYEEGQYFGDDEKYYDDVNEYTLMDAFQPIDDLDAFGMLSQQSGDSVDDDLYSDESYYDDETPQENYFTNVNPWRADERRSTTPPPLDFDGHRDQAQKVPMDMREAQSKRKSAGIRNPQDAHVKGPKNKKRVAKNISDRPRVADTKQDNFFNDDGPPEGYKYPDQRPRGYSSPF